MHFHYVLLKNYVAFLQKRKMYERKAAGENRNNWKKITFIKQKKLYVLKKLT